MRPITTWSKSKCHTFVCSVWLAQFELGLIELLRCLSAVTRVTLLRLTSTKFCLAYAIILPMFVKLIIIIILFFRGCNFWVQCSVMAAHNVRISWAHCLSSLPSAAVALVDALCTMHLYGSIIMHMQAQCTNIRLFAHNKGKSKRRANILLIAFAPWCFIEN